MKTAWQFLHVALNTEGRALLFCVADHQGSTPGKTGFKMVLTPSGRRWGTIGGGIMEFNLREEAQSPGFSTPTKRHLVHQKSAADDLRSGLICSGSQTIVITPVNQSQLPALEACLQQPEPQGWALWTAQGIGFQPQRPNPKGNLDLWYCEPLSRQPRAYVIGGGHIGLALCRILATLDFQVTVIDDRPDLDTMAENSFAEKHVSSYENLNQIIHGGPDTFIAVVTASAPSDLAALRELPGTEAAYLGLMGSKSKRHFIFDALRSAGIPRDFIASIRSPIGMAINAVTPSEIALSIAAEMTSVRRNGQG